MKWGVGGGRISSTETIKLIRDGAGEKKGEAGMEG